MHDVDWNRLDVAAYRVSMKRSVRRLAWYMSIIGAIVAGTGIAAPFVPLVVVGLVLFSAGLWNLFRPSIGGLIVDGVAMILTGAFQCLVWMWMESARTTGIGKGLLAGIFQIVWGVRRIAMYPTARTAYNDPEAIARLEAAIRELSKRKAKSDLHVVEFRTGGLRKHTNRVGLYAEGEIALLEGQAVRLEKRADIWIEPQGTSSLGSRIKVGIQMSDLRLTGDMLSEHFERFERWKLGQSQAPPVAA